MAVDPRQVRALAFLRRLMPPPAPTAGWGMVRQQIAAQALGVLADEQTTLAEHQLVLNATQTLSKGTWAGDEFAWGFRIASQIGAGGRWLDVWGKILGIPRTTGEADQAYGQRILIEIAHASSANAGIAWSLDRILGTTGTEVIDTATFLATVYRANMGLKANNGLRANNRGRFLDTACCYIVRLTEAPTLYSVDDVEWIVRRLQAAGTRLVLVQDDSASNTVTISGPSYLIEGSTAAITASTVDGKDSTWEWTVAGASIVGDASGSSIAIIPTTSGTVNVYVQRTTQGTPVQRQKEFFTVFRPVVVLSTTQSQPAGKSGLIAYLPYQEGFDYTWTIQGGSILSGQGTHEITFTVGEANKTEGASAVITCNASCPERGISTSGSTSLDILPYPRFVSFTTGIIAGNSTSTGAITSGREIYATRVTLSAPARIRLYETEAQRNADVGRRIGDAVASDNGLIFEAYANEASDITLDPEGHGVNGESPVRSRLFWTVDNLSSSDAAVTVGIYYRQEA